MNYSVALCTFNGEKFIIKQLLSIIFQSIQPSEIVIFDDDSYDNTLKNINLVANKFKNIVWKIHKNSKRVGVVNNFANAIQACTSDIIFLSDQDDVWLPNKAKKIMTYFKNEKNVAVFSDAYIVDDRLTKYNRTLFEILGFNAFLQKQFLANAREVLLTKFIVSGCTLSFRKKLIDTFLPIPNNEVFIHDAWIAILSSFFGNIVFIDEPLILYRQHSNNTIGVSDKQEENLPPGKFEHLIFILKKNFNKEKLVYTHFKCKKFENQRLYLEKRKSTYILLLNSNSFFRRLMTVLRVTLVSKIPEFRTVRSYIGNSFIYIFKINSSFHICKNDKK